MARKKAREGSLIRISLGNGFDAFARVLDRAQVAFYDCFVQHDQPIPGNIYSAEILWTFAVMKPAFSSPDWDVVDYKPLEPELLINREYFIKDKLSGKYSIYSSMNGSMTPSTFEACKNLEPAAVWSANHVEDRLNDHIAGVPNVWVESMKATP